MTVDGCYLVNCTKGDQRRSAVAYYKHAIVGGGNDGHQPEAFAYTDLNNFIDWEGAQQSVTFDSGVKFSWRIDGNAQSKQLGDKVGSADNGFENWTIFKDINKYMFTNADGFDCIKVYFVN